jgi:hypothetical protein
MKSINQPFHQFYSSFSMELKVRLFSKYETFLENLIHDLDIVLHEPYHGCYFLVPHKIFLLLEVNS